MNYYLDQEFHEYFKKPISWLPTIGNFNKKYHTIELISIGIVAEDGREYYAVCNEFNVRNAYNKFQVEKTRNYGDSRNISEYRYTKKYWLRENVLSPIFFAFYKQGLVNLHYITDMSLSKMKGVIEAVGKSKKQIAQEVFEFCTGDSLTLEKAKHYEVNYENREIKFYGYYADYDWVLFCSLFGTMMDLPKGFPMYCKDLQQMKDDYKYLTDKHPDYPKQQNEHHALYDAKWNFELHKFLEKINN